MRYNGLFQTLGKNVVKVAEFAFATELVYGSIRKLGHAFNLLSVYKMNSRRSPLLSKELGASADDFTGRFLQSGIKPVFRQVKDLRRVSKLNLLLFRLTSNVGDFGERERITQQLSKLQLSTQTAFGLSKDQSIDSVGVIFRQIVDQGVWAGEAVDNLTTLMDKFTVAMQNSGVKGSELVQTFAQLVGASQELNISQDELVALTAVYSQASNKSPQETSNSIKALAERIFGKGRTI